MRLSFSLLAKGNPYSGTREIFVWCNPESKKFYWQRIKIESGIQAPLTRKAKKLIGIQYRGIGIHRLKYRSESKAILDYLTSTWGDFFDIFPLAVWVILELSFCWIVVRLIPVWGKFPWNFQGFTGNFFCGKVVHDHEVHLNVQVKFLFSWRVCRYCAKEMQAKLEFSFQTKMRRNFASNVMNRNEISRHETKFRAGWTKFSREQRTKNTKFRLHFFCTVLYLRPVWEMISKDLFQYGGLLP